MRNSCPVFTVDIVISNVQNNNHNNSNQNNNNEIKVENIYEERENEWKVKM